MDLKVTVVIVSFNTCDKLRRCLGCIEPEHEIVVVDNASHDGSAAMVRQEFPSVMLIESPTNLGFGRGNNLGCTRASGDLILFLNSDAYADPGAIRKLASVFADAGVVAVGGRQLNPDRSLQFSTANRLTLWSVFCEQTYLEKAFPTSSWLSPYWTTARLAVDLTPKKSPQVMGATLMVRASAGRPIEAFDERYFLYCEDTDLCRRLEVHGTILYVPEATFVHDLGSSSAKDPSLGVTRYNRGKELYFAIHYGRLASLLCFILDRLGAGLRVLAWSLRHLASGFRNERARSQAKAFWRVLWAKPRG